MTPALREMLSIQWREQAATEERQRILEIAQHGASVGRFEAAVELARNPEMTVELAAQILAVAP